MNMSLAFATNKSPCWNLLNSRYMVDLPFNSSLLSIFCPWVFLVHPHHPPEFGLLDPCRCCCARLLIKWMCDYPMLIHFPEWILVPLMISLWKKYANYLLNSIWKMLLILSRVSLHFMICWDWYSWVWMINLLLITWCAYLCVIAKAKICLLGKKVISFRLIHLWH